MHVNFYKKPQIKTHKTPIKVEKSVLFLDYLEHFISNSTTKRVQGYKKVGLAQNTIRTYKFFFRNVKGSQFEKSEESYLNSINKYIAESFTCFLKIVQQVSVIWLSYLLTLTFSYKNPKKIIFSITKHNTLYVLMPYK